MMKAFRERLRFVATISVLLGGAGPAPGFARDACAAATQHADDYEATIKRGVALRREGKDREALAEFQRALAVRETPQALAQIGLAEQALGVWLAAEEHLQRALKGKGDPWLTRNEATLRKSLAAVAQHLGGLEIWGEPAAAEVIVNGKSAGTLGASPSTRVVAGTCSVVVRADGYEDLMRQIQVGGGGGIVRENVQLVPLPPKRALVAPPPPVADVPPAAPALEVTTAPTESEPSPTETTGLTRKWWFWTIVGAVVVGGATTAFLVSRPQAGLACPATGNTVCPQ
jgi:PEGA domain